MSLSLILYGSKNHYCQIKIWEKKPLFLGIIKLIWEKKTGCEKKQLYFGSKNIFGSRKNNKWLQNKFKKQVDTTFLWSLLIQWSNIFTGRGAQAIKAKSYDHKEEKKSK